ncbi:MAG: tripartite tricarboxylate transporter TctB family protein [Kocuria sp.]|nr:tripartite tricarboxylate transporter TctB family protein [Kocuria sp.]
MNSTDDQPQGGPLADRVIAGLVLLTAILLLLFTLGFPAPVQSEDPGTAALPRLVGGGLLILGVALFLRPETATVAPPRGARARLTAVVIATVILVLVVVPLGFPITMALFLAFTLWLMGVRNLVGLVVYPIVASAFLYYLFAELLDVYLPAGILEGLI